MTKKPEALRLAERLDDFAAASMFDFYEEELNAVAAELRRLHAENAGLLEQNTMLDAKLAELERVNAQLLEALEQVADAMPFPVARAAIAAAKGEA